MVYGHWQTLERSWVGKHPSPLQINEYFGRVADELFGVVTVEWRDPYTKTIVPWPCPRIEQHATWAKAFVEARPIYGDFLD